MGEPWTFLEAQPAGPGEKLLEPCDKWFCNPSHMAGSQRIYSFQIFVWGLLICLKCLFSGFSVVSFYTFLVSHVFCFGPCGRNHLGRSEEAAEFRSQMVILRQPLGTKALLTSQDIFKWLSVVFWVSQSPALMPKNQNPSAYMADREMFFTSASGHFDGNTQTYAAKFDREKGAFTYYPMAWDTRHGGSLWNRCCYAAFQHAF